MKQQEISKQEVNCWQRLDGHELEQSQLSLHSLIHSFQYSNSLFHSINIVACKNVRVNMQLYVNIYLQINHTWLSQIVFTLESNKAVEFNHSLLFPSRLSFPSWNIFNIYYPRLSQTGSSPGHWIIGSCRHLEVLVLFPVTKQ